MNSLMNPTRLTPIYTAARGLNAQFVQEGEWQVANVYSSVAAEVEAAEHGVALADRTHRGRLMVEGNEAAAAVEAAFGTADLAIGQGADADSASVYRLRQDQFFVSISMSEAAEIAGKLNQAAIDNGLITVTDVTDGRAELWLMGPKSTEVLSLLCGLDLHDSEFPNQAAKVSSVAKTRQLIVRRDIGRVRAYALIGQRSFAAYLWETITAAGQKSSIIPIGQLALERLI